VSVAVCVTYWIYKSKVTTHVLATVRQSRIGKCLTVADVLFCTGGKQVGLTIKLWNYVREITDQNLDHVKGLFMPRINVCSQTQLDSTALTSVNSLQQYWMFTDCTGQYRINVCR